MINSEIINGILKGYIEAALWTEEEELRSQSGYGDDEEIIFGDGDYDDELEKLVSLTANINKKPFINFTREDVEDNSLIKAYTDIKEFINTVGEETITAALEDVEPEKIGIHLWLSRNHHGSGFFDGDYDYDIEKILMNGADKLGTVDMYINHSNKVSFSNEHMFESKNTLKIIITESQFKSLFKKINGVEIYPNLDNIDENKSIGYGLLIEECKKYKSSEELLKSGGFSDFALDLAAFGFTEDSVKILSPKNLTIKWKTDLENVFYEVKKSNLTPIEWSKKVNINKPIDVSFDGKKFYLEDGHHRYFAAKTLKKKLNVDLVINANPILPLSNKGYDQFHIDLFNKSKNILLESQQDYLKWKRKNVTLRGVKELNKHNDVYGSFGNGLYSAFLSNKKMAKEYGKVYFVLNAIPKNPKVLQDLNSAEIFIQNLINNWCKKRDEEYNPRLFHRETSIKDEMLNLGYDGLVIKGREMVNYSPSEDVKYFENEHELIKYYENNVLKNLNEQLSYIPRSTVSSTYVAKKPYPQLKYPQIQQKNDLPFNKITDLTIKHIEGGYYNPAQGNNKGLGDSGETMFGMDRKHGTSFTNSSGGKLFWSLIDQDRKKRPNKWKYLYTLDDNPQLKQQLIKIITDYWLTPNYNTLTTKYLTKDAKQIVDNDPRLKYHMSYGIWNGEGWFRRFAKKLNDVVSRGYKDVNTLFNVAMNSRINSGNKFIAQSGKKIKDIVSPQIA